jgi:hypothetical protein
MMTQMDDTELKLQHATELEVEHPTTTIIDINMGMHLSSYTFAIHQI